MPSECSDINLRRTGNGSVEPSATAVAGLAAFIAVPVASIILLALVWMGNNRDIGFFPVSTLPGALISHAFRLRNGPILRTLIDLRAFILSEPKAVQERNIWQCASELLLTAAKHDGDIGAVTEKVELALFLDERLLPMATAVPGQPPQTERPERDGAPSHRRTRDPDGCLRWSPMRS
jgi:hypothetical protein